MASEMRRLAQALVAEHGESFRSRYPRAESERRLAIALEGFRPRGLEFETAWRDSPQGVQLDLAMKPAPRSRRFLHVSSLVFLLLFAATAYSFLDSSRTQSERVIVSLVTLVALLSFPFVVTAYGSRREAEEATLRRAIRRHLVDEEAPRA